MICNGWESIVTYLLRNDVEMWALFTLHRRERFGSEQPIDRTVLDTPWSQCADVWSLNRCFFFFQLRMCASGPSVHACLFVHLSVCPHTRLCVATLTATASLLQDRLQAHILWIMHVYRLHMGKCRKVTICVWWWLLQNETQVTWRGVSVSLPEVIFSTIL